MAEEFALLAKKVEHDLHLVKVWGQKIRDRESQLYYHGLHHKEARLSKAAGAAAPSGCGCSGAFTGRCGPGGSYASCGRGGEI